MDQMKKTNTTTVAGDCIEWCQTCRARASTGHPGPYTSAELMRFVGEPDRPDPDPDPDPDVVAAEAERDTARTVFDSLNLSWQSALAAKTRADIHGHGTTAERRRLN